MNCKTTLFAIAGLIASAAGAQTRSAPATVQSPATKAAAGTTVKAPVVRTAKSLDCSKQADTKGLHGKPRKTFMSSCKKS